MYLISTNGPIGLTGAELATIGTQNILLLLRIEPGSDICGMYAPNAHMPGSFGLVGSLPIGIAYTLTKALGTPIQGTGIMVVYKRISPSRLRIILERLRHMGRQTTGPSLCK
jgi:hypothetical protein